MKPLYRFLLSEWNLLCEEVWRVGLRVGLMFVRCLLFLAIFVFVANLVLATTAKAWAASDLFDEPCARYGVPKAVALSIAKVESNLAPWVVNVAGKDFQAKTREQALYIIHAARAYGLSHDIGIMQINNYWLRKFGISPEVALEPRNNVQLGVYILACEIRRHGFSWKAVGAYHSPTPWRQAQYAARVAKFYNLLRKQEG